MLPTQPVQTPRPVQLESVARQLAESHAIAEHPLRRPSLLERLEGQETALRAAYRHFAGATDTQLALSYAAEWILDNFYVIEQALRQVREDMPAGYYQQLPKLGPEPGPSPWEGYPRVYAVAQGMIGYCEQRLDADRVTRFVRAYQRIAPLTVGELWALPTMLRLGTLENLAQAVGYITGQPYDSGTLFPAVALPRELADETIVANCILSLRMLGTQDWKAFFEDVSQVEQVLRRDPAGVYSRMDFDTRNRYRQAVEGLALALKRDEGEIAHEAIRFAEEARQQTASEPTANLSITDSASSERTAHVGFYLLDKGRVQLEARLGYRPSLNERLSRWLLDHPTLTYLGDIALITLTILFGLIGYAALVGGTLVQVIAVSLLTALPTSAVAVSLVNWLAVQFTSPRLLPRLDFQAGIPPDCRTMVVIPALLTSAADIQSLLSQLELHYLSNTDPNLYFALLADFGDAPQEHMPEDDALLEQSVADIQTLNKKYGQQGIGPFYLFFRERKWNPSEGYWMGWERKRGKLTQFNKLLRGEGAPFTVQLGNLDVLPTIRYVITIDTDTSMPRESARRLIATLAHPLNRAEFDPETGAVIAGYTVLQPRVEITPTSAAQSLFARIFSGDSGVDLYTRAVSDVYQDLFGEGIYAGKGIYDVEAFVQSLDGRVPENALLSHDLFEGVYGRAGLVTDVILFEDYPAHYLARMHRLHRWVRGDWQLLPWLLPRVRGDGDSRIPNDFSVIDRWKIVDNLRRSLLAPVLLVFLIAGWLWLPGPALVWTLVGLFALTGPILTGLAGSFALVRPIFAGLVGVSKRGVQGMSLAGTAQLLWTMFLRWLLSLAFLLYESLIMIDAIGATLVRLLFTHRKLLQWTTANHTIRLFGRETKLGLLWRKMGSTSILAWALTWLVFLLNKSAFLVAAPFLFVWITSPYLAYWISLPIMHREAPLSTEQHRQLHRLARRTWLYFEQFVGPDDQWLPPDHFQQDPLGLVAHRTSPTNIGLLLLSTLAAYDLGYIGALELILRLRPTFEGIARLECYRGHLLNWYDTRDLKPLPPRYISTVDSGNLASSLLVLKQGCEELTRAPILRWQRWQGLLDTLDVLAEIVESLQESALESAVISLLAHLEHIRRQVQARRDTPLIWAPLLVELGEEAWQVLEQLLIALVESGARTLDVATLRDLRIWSERVSYQLLGMQSEFDVLLPWLLPLSQPPALFTQPGVDLAIATAWRALVDALPIASPLDELAEVCKAGQAQLAQLQSLLAVQDGSVALVQEARDWCAHLSHDLLSARMAAESLLIGLRDLGTQVDQRFRGIDFRFLFDSHRQIFHIGYNVENETLDSNCYDLLASEARIAGLIAIAKGDIPQSHWLHLARPMTRVNGAQVLLSWGGTMFEYLMPFLVMHSYTGSFLEQSCRAAVQRQITYGRQKGVPWGASESGYYRFDAGMHYQYRGFGVPGLGFRRGLAEDLVIAPYASLLALSLFPQDVMQNITHLAGEGMHGRYGFYEAVDYTRSRLSADQNSAIVRSFMVHHQGMILLALDNYLKDQALVRRFHADPRIQSIELLLQEQIPRQSPLEHPHPEEIHPVRLRQPQVIIAPWRVPVDAPIPQAHVLSNGRYSVLITSVGSGYSVWQGVDLTRWRADAALDDWGTWIYVQDCESGALWSAGRQPTGIQSRGQEVLFHAHMAVFRRHDHDISLRMEITVPPDDDVEIRRITLTNQSDRPRQLALASYGEVVLAPQAADSRHPAFSKLFVESGYMPEINGLLFHRRPRSAAEESLFLAHLLVTEDERDLTSAHEGDRACFLGRGRTLRSPAALSSSLPHPSAPLRTSAGGTGGGGLSGTTGATLDPIMALGQEFTLPPHATARVAYVTLAARSREEALALACRYQPWPRVERAFDRARSRGELELRRLDLPTPQLERIEQLLSVLLYPHAALRAAPATLAANNKGQPGLWAYAISGDHPILLVRVGSQEELELVRELLQAHAYWRDRQLKVDLVILNERDTSYDQELQGQLYRLVARMDSDAWLNRRGGIFILRADLMGRADRTLLETAARAVLDGKRGRLIGQLKDLREQPERLPRFVPALSGLEDVEPTPPLLRPGDLLFDNGLGGFSADGREYVIYLKPGQQTPAPWINVVANPEFGFLASEAGAGTTWAGNSGENRLTPWRNDPVADLPGEALYLRDEETAQVWSPTPLPTPGPGPYLVRHGAGYSTFEHHCHGLKQRLRLFAVPDAPVKVIHLRLENTWRHTRRITVTFYAEWVLGVTRDVTQQYIVPEFDPASQALLARNPYNEEFGERMAFVAASREPHGLTADRIEFLGREGSLSRPAALERIGLSGVVQAGLDPCAAFQVHLDLPAGEAQEIFFLLGEGANREEAFRLVKRYRDAAQVEAAWQAVGESWDRLLSAVSVHTPDPAMDLLLNRWLLYQTLVCRLWGRSALYQSSGAFGYRDQLQDVMALVHAAPDVAREHILRAARYQFEEGDVLHWWHPPSGRGVRTRCSDDLLWLPFVAAHYVNTTGDEAILSEIVPFLAGDPLEPEEAERYGRYEPSTGTHSLYEHCRRALERGMTAGSHGLPLIGSGDWNDGLNRVGSGGRGESIWLGWFLYATLTGFTPVCDRLGDQKCAAAFRQRADSLRQALERHSWDWGWYRRGYYDDGTPLGSSESDECQIDSIAQSWGILSGAADPQRAALAMQAVAARLVRRDDGLVLLFTPPFDKTERDPGYVKGYPPGIRENGGQYTHAALWVAWAFAEMGDGDRAGALFRMLNPIHRADTPEKAARYRVEPYVVAADVYSVPPHVGRGGWTWYTGSAGWMYRLGLEAILGVRRVGRALQIAPCIPKNWPGYEVTYRDGATVYHIRVENPSGVNRGVRQVTLDGKTLPEAEIPLTSDGQRHEVRVVMG